MADIVETSLPGIGIRYDFACRSGPRLGVVVRHSGRRELAVYDEADPDRVASTVDLAEDESAALAELLGGTRITEQLTDLTRTVAGLAVDWLPLDPGSPTRTIGGTGLRTRTGATVVAILRGDDTLPAPGPADELRPGDTLVLIGTPEGIADATRLLSG